MSDPVQCNERLPDPSRRLHRVLLEALLEREVGTVPSPETLAARTEIAVSEVPDRLQALAAADYLALDAAGRVVCLYPFSVTPTPHVVVIAGQRRYAMCAIDALGVPAMLGQELAIDARCAVCNAPIALRVRPGEVVAAAPPTTMVVARRDEAEPAFAACCPFTVFLCDREHADQFMRRITGAHALSLSEALTHAEEIFGGLLADALPVTRPRGKQWGRSRDG